MSIKAVMSLSHSVGSQIQLVFQPKFQTFTPDQLDKALKDKGFQITQGQVVTPQGQTLPIQIFSKGNLLISLIPNPPPNPANLVFQILNTLNLTSTTAETSIIDTIIEILKRLNIIPEVIAAISFNCTSMIQASKKEPVKGLASVVKQEAFDPLQEVTQNLKLGSLNVTSLRLGTGFPIELERKGLQITMEPLATSPTHQYYLNIIYKTDTESEFGAFIRQFGEDFINNIRKALGE